MTITERELEAMSKPSQRDFDVAALLDACRKLSAIVGIGASKALDLVDAIIARKVTS